MSEEWLGRAEGGGHFAIWLLRFIALHLGRPVARALLYPITLYFYLRRPYERRSSYRFLERAFGKPASAWQVLRHLHRFGGTILDRVFLLTDHFSRFEVCMHGLDELDARIEPGRGVLLLGSHVGSFEVLRVAADLRPEIKVRVVLDTQQTPALTELLHDVNPEMGRNVIDASRPATEVVLALSEAIGAGHLATLLADRARPNEATVAVHFMGSPAAFPVAPFLIGSVLKAPIMLCFGMYHGGNRYDLHFEPFSDCLSLPRQHRASELTAVVQRYATRLEHYVREDPYNWFNWHDVWNLESSAHSATRVDKIAQGPAALGKPALDQCPVPDPSVLGDAA